jgi:catechol 2,3-dioxygenase-like lactoylglutathione lyase family enzyme
MAIPPIKFGHVAFRVTDAERSVQWYKAAFGARRVFHAPRKGDRQELMFLELSPSGRRVPAVLTIRSRSFRTPTATSSS